MPNPLPSPLMMSFIMNTLQIKQPDCPTTPKCQIVIKTGLKPVKLWSYFMGNYNHQFKAKHSMLNEIEQEQPRSQQHPNHIQIKQKRISKYRKLFLRRLAWKTKITSVKYTDGREFNKMQVSKGIDSHVTSHSLDYFQFTDFQE